MLVRRKIIAAMDLFWIWSGAIWLIQRPGSDVQSLIDGKPTEAGSPDQRLDESPAGYSLAGWSPPEPVSASPTEAQYEGIGVA